MKDRPALVRATLGVSAAYLLLIGLALTFFPLQFGRGAVPEPAPGELTALLRLLGGPFLGLAVLNWLGQNEAPGSLRIILLANAVGFGAVAANDLWGVASGEARDIARLFLVIHLAFAVAFLAALRGTGRPAPPAERGG